MNESDFEELVLQDETLRKSINRSAYHYSPPGYAGSGLTEAASIALLFPIVKYILTHIGLPWLHEVTRYSELWRLKFHKWIDSQYEDDKIEIARVTAVSNALRQELESMTDASARESWERLAALIKNAKEGEQTSEQEG